jgi:Arc/MetJ-type ribon-helix-helix transcriptional regulator
MTIELKPEQERIIQEEIRNGHFGSAEEVLDHALAALREKNSPTQPEVKKSRKNFTQFLMESPLAGSGLDF